VSLVRLPCAMLRKGSSGSPCNAVQRRQVRLDHRAGVEQHAIHVEEDRAGLKRSEGCHARRVRLGSPDRADSRTAPSGPGSPTGPRSRPRCGRRHASFPAIGEPGASQGPALRQRHDRTSGLLPLGGPAIDMLFRPEEKHGLSGEDDVFPPARRGMAKWMTPSVAASPSGPTASSMRSPQQPHAVSIAAVSPSMAGMPSASQMQLANALYPGVWTRKAVGTAEKGAAMRISPLCCSTRIRAAASRPRLPRTSSSGRKVIRQSAAMVGGEPRVSVNS
jgi:hypothetical protein